MNRDTTEMTAAELSARIGGQVVGDGNTLISRVAGLEGAGPGDLAFVEAGKLSGGLQRSGASCLIVPEGAQVEAPCVIEVKRPKLAFALAASLLQPRGRREPGVHPTAVVAASASVDALAHVGPYVRVGERTRVGAGTELLSGVSLGDDVSVGGDCVLHPNVVLYDGVHLGDRVILHAGVVVGADGFGYVPDEENVRHKFPQVGTVLIEDDVEVGACTCIDRGALGQTRIGRHTKIDNLVQIAHNVEIGERVVIAAQTGISGSTVVEDDALIGGQVGMGDHARVQSGAVIGSKAGILPGKIVRPGVWWGIPVQPLEDYKRLNAHFNRLPQLREEVKELRRELSELKARMAQKE